MYYIMIFMHSFDRWKRTTAKHGSGCQISSRLVRLQQQLRWRIGFFLSCVALSSSPDLPLSPSCDCKAKQLNRPLQVIRGGRVGWLLNAGLTREF